MGGSTGVRSCAWATPTNSSPGGRRAGLAPPCPLPAGPGPAPHPGSWTCRAPSRCEPGHHRGPGRCGASPGHRHPVRGTYHDFVVTAAQHHVALEDVPGVIQAVVHVQGRPEPAGKVISSPTVSRAGCSGARPNGGEERRPELLALSLSLSLSLWGVNYRADSRSIPPSFHKVSARRHTVR
jgi:hypothetical protein